jgi:pilus assembly protein Flp/PilA
MRNIIKNQKGQGLVEYLIIVSIMAIGTMAILRVMNQTVQAKFARITQTLQGNDSSVSIRVESLQESDFKKRDMSDFFHGASSGKSK